MPPKHKPWWKVDADADESDKIGRLPSDAARWAWFRMGCKAKTQRRLGVFAGRSHLKSLIGSSGRFVPALVAAGLAHDWPTTCPRCSQAYLSDATDGDLVVHDYRREQRDPTAADRQADFRDRNAERHDISNGGLTPSSRALSPSLSPSPSPSPGEDEPYQVAGDPEPALVLPPEAHDLRRLTEELTQRPNVLANVWGGLGEKAVRLVRKHGFPAVEREFRRIAAEENGMPELRQLVFGADEALNRVPRPPAAATPADRKAEITSVVDHYERLAREAAARG